MGEMQMSSRSPRLMRDKGGPHIEAQSTFDHPINVGEVLDLAEEDYCYGRGRLRLRVTKVVDVQRFDDGMWVNLVGMRVFDSGTEGEERFALVRLSAIQRH